MRLRCAVALLLLTGLPAWPQSLGEIARKNREAKEAKKSAKVLTNDDLSPNQADKIPPNLPPGAQNCNTDQTCFLAAIDKGGLAWMIKSEKAYEESVLLTSSTTWWTTGYTGNKCSFSVQLNDYSAQIDEERAKRRPQDRPRIESQLEQLKQQFPGIKGKENTCRLTRADLKKALTGPGLSVTTAAVLAFYEKSCTGPLFPDKR